MGRAAPVDPDDMRGAKCSGELRDSVPTIMDDAGEVPPGHARQHRPLHLPFDVLDIARVHRRGADPDDGPTSARLGVGPSATDCAPVRVDATVVTPIMLPLAKVRSSSHLCSFEEKREWRGLLASTFLIKSGFRSG